METIFLFVQKLPFRSPILLVHISISLIQKHYIILFIKLVKKAIKAHNIKQRPNIKLCV